MEFVRQNGPEDIIGFSYSFAWHWGRYITAQEQETRERFLCADADLTTLDQIIRKVDESLEYLSGLESIPNLCIPDRRRWTPIFE